MPSSLKTKRGCLATPLTVTSSSPRNKFRGEQKLLLKSRAKTIPTVCERLYLGLIRVTTTKIVPLLHKAQRFLNKRLFGTSGALVRLWDT